VHAQNDEEATLAPCGELGDDEEDDDIADVVGACTAPTDVLLANGCIIGVWMQ
jgi:hypothetical protein